MNSSPSIGALAAALAKAQGVMKGATKDSANPFFKSKYADLASVWEACREALAANGLAVVQATQATDGATIIVETILAHSSGEWVTSQLAMVPVKADPQGIGSCITYARRYALAAMVGVAPEDDDGNAASGKNGAPPATTGLKPMVLVAPPRPPEAPRKPDQAQTQAKTPPAPSVPVTDTLEAEVVETVNVSIPPSGGVQEKFEVNGATGNEVRLYHRVAFKGKTILTAGVLTETFHEVQKSVEMVGEKKAKQLLWGKFSLSSTKMLDEPTAQKYLSALSLAADAK